MDVSPVARNLRTMETKTYVHAPVKPSPNHRLGDGARVSGCGAGRRTPRERQLQVAVCRWPSVSVWKLYGSLSRPDLTHRDRRTSQRTPFRLQRPADDPQPPGLAGILQAGGHRFESGWLHSEVACKQVVFLLKRSPPRVSRKRLKPLQRPIAPDQGGGSCS
jgi:hypothetical protein